MLEFNRMRWSILGVGLSFLAACGSSTAIPGGEVPENALSEYIIGPGDSLRINVWNNPEVSSSVPVRPDGKISTPLVEDMPAVGKTPTQLARDIEVVLADYIRSPKVTVIVGGFQGAPGQQIRVIGQAMSPQTLAYREGMTVLDVMIAVGGLGEFAAGNRAKIVRKVDGQDTEIKVQLNDLINKGQIEENVEMRPGDILIIPQSRF